MECNQLRLDALLQLQVYGDGQIWNRPTEEVWRERQKVPTQGRPSAGPKACEFVSVIADMLHCWEEPRIKWERNEVN